MSYLPIPPSEHRSATAARAPLSAVLDLRLLHYFVAVAEQLSFSRAAESLFVSEPVLSRQIRLLERRVGAPLFNRTKRVVRLTEAGQHLLPEACQLIEHAERLADELARASKGEAGHLRVGFIAAAANSILPELVAAFHLAYPDVELTLRELRSDELLEETEQRRLDLALTHAPLDGFDVESEVVLTEPVAAVLPMGHPLAGDASLPLSALANESFIMQPRYILRGGYDETIYACRQAGFSPRIVQEAISTTARFGLVAAGLGVALSGYSNRKMSREGVVFVPIEGMTVDLAVIWPTHALSRSGTRLLEVARALAKKEVQL